MPDQQQFPDNDRLSRLLRESIDRFLARLDIEERTSAVHEDRVHFDEWVRYCLVTALVPDVLAVACAVFDYDAEVLNNRIPELIKRALTPIPMDSRFIGDVMSGLPDHLRMQIVGENLHLDGGDRTLADEARQSFDAALYETLDIDDPPIEGDWLHPATQRSGVS